MSECVIEKFSPNANAKDLELQFVFCKALTETDTNGFYWPTKLMSANNLDEFRAGLRALAAKEEYDLTDLRERGHVPQQHWWIKNAQNVPIGIAKVRYVLTPFMLRYGGHVGLGLGEKYRGQGYGAAALSLIVKECYNNGLKDILLTVRPDNTASRRMIEANGGKLWDIVHREEGDAVRYWISAE